MVKLSLKPVELPVPFNLWQNQPVEADGTLKANPPVSKRGDCIIMRAVTDLVICVSACPWEITSICGNKPRKAYFEILRLSESRRFSTSIPNSGDSLFNSIFSLAISSPATRLPAID
jgi:uncharacterized protein YcgI (DUF1989 family)